MLLQQMAGYDGVQFYAVPSGGSFRRYIVTSHGKMAGGSGTSEASSGLQRIFDTDSSGSEELDPLDPDSDESWHPSTSSSSSDDVSLEISRINEESPEKPKPSQKRTRNIYQWKKNKPKRRQNAGQQYKSLKTHKTVQAATIGSPCTCLNKCFTKLLGEEENIFHSFWDIGNFNVQNTYLMSCMKMEPKKRRKT
ncbi:uncharacterized protein LOC126485027 [Schistocerca serialis cubense]|uniref:uncharacterized protein LOC126485027 n=1 Tax=Schistocerca serialis cubense TaxID=2023355 RepID=UPI00214E0A41|nr:uncharacterized protein LOC126485027 [Schistocerca serialis cubense]